MKIAVFSDIHANPDKLEVGLKAIKEKKPDAIWCLGDIVGYGIHPSKTIQLVMDNCDLVLAGNHDYAASGRFPEFIEYTPHWLSNTLRLVPADCSFKELEFLRKIQPSRRELGIEMFHASRRDPIMEFIDESNVVENLLAQDGRLTLFGHTHVPFAASIRKEDKREKEAVKNLEIKYPEDTQELEFDDDRLYMLNPGALGLNQFKDSRVRDKRSGWMLLELDDKLLPSKATWYRIDNPNF